MSHTIAVMYLGQIVEWGPAEVVALEPRHPYTQALFAAALPIDFDAPPPTAALAGEVPSPLRPPAGCRFHPRCPHAMPHCATDPPAPRPHAGRLPPLLGVSNLGRAPIPTFSGNATTQRLRKKCRNVRPDPS